MNAITEKALLNPDAAPEIEWADPIPFEVKICAETEYPTEALPDAIRSAVNDVQALTQAPIALVATEALSCISVVSQGYVNVMRDQHLISPVSLYTLCVAESGERKTTVDRYFTEPIRKYESDQVKAMEPQIIEIEANLKSWQAEEAGIHEAIKVAAKLGKPTDDLKRRLLSFQDKKPIIPRIPSILYCDTTSEALAFNLAEKWPVAGILNSEAGVILGSHSMGSDSIVRNLALFNTLWDGSEHTVSRRTKESFTVRGARLTVSLQVQNAVLSAFLTKSGSLARGIGFLARFLFTRPESTQGTRFYRDAPESLHGLNTFNERIAELLDITLPWDNSNTYLEPKTISLSDEARKAWIQYYDRIESMLGTDGDFSEIRDVASKTAEQAARIAGIFHFFQHCDQGRIDAETMESATAIAFWHLCEFQRFNATQVHDPDTLALQKLDSWLIDQFKSCKLTSISTTSALQYSPIRKSADLEAAVQKLSKLNRAELVKNGNKKSIRINPKLLTRSNP